MHGIAKPHHFHHFLQTTLLLIDDVLHDHCSREYPRQRHEQRRRSRDGFCEPEYDNEQLPTTAMASNKYIHTQSHLHIQY